LPCSFGVLWHKLEAIRRKYNPTEGSERSFSLLKGFYSYNLLAYPNKFIQSTLGTLFYYSQTIKLFLGIKESDK
jgi:hypothetical protein